MPLLEEYANAATLLEQQHMPQIPLPTNLEQAGAHLRNEYAALAEQLRETGQHALLDALPPESHLFRAAGDDGAVLDDDGAAASSSWRRRRTGAEHAAAEQPQAAPADCAPQVHV